MENSLQDREYLFKRHRLSHRQIDNLLGESKSKEFIQTSLQSLEFLKHFIELIDLLNLHNISYINFKGPLLSQLIYGDPTVRYSNDIDILIDKNDMDEINQILLDAGYTFLNNMTWPDNKKQQGVLLNFMHHLGYWHREHGFMVEIHWSFSSMFPIRATALQEIISGNLQQENFYGRKLMTFSPEFNLLYLIFHGSKHAWQRLKWLVDIKDYPFDKIDKDKFERLIIQFHAQRIVSQAYFILKHYFDYEQPLLFRTTVPDHMQEYVYAFVDEPVKEQQNVKEYISATYYRFLLFKNIYYKFSVFREMMTYTKDIFKIRSSYRIVYFLYRPYSYIKRRVFHAK